MKGRNAVEGERLASRCGQVRKRERAGVTRGPSVPRFPWNWTEPSGTEWNAAHGGATRSDRYRGFTMGSGWFFVISSCVELGPYTVCRFVSFRPVSRFDVPQNSIASHAAVLSGVLRAGSTGITRPSGFHRRSRLVRELAPLFFLSLGFRL